MNRTPKVLLVFALVVCLFIIAGAVGIALSIAQRPSAPKAEVITRNTLQEAERAHSAHRQSVETARAELSPKLGIPEDWSFDAAFEEWSKGRYEVLGDFMTRYLAESGTASASAVADLARAIESRNEIDAFTAQFHPGQHGTDGVLRNLEEFLRTSEDLKWAAVAMRNRLYFHEYELDASYYDDQFVLGTGRQNLTRALATRAVFEARAGECQQALDTFAALAEFALQVGEEPYLANISVRCTIEEIADYALWIIFDSCELDEAALAPVRSLIERRKDASVLYARIREDAALYDVREYFWDDVDDSLDPVSRWMLSLARPNFSQGITAAADRLISLLERPYHEMRDAIENVYDDPNYGHGVSFFLESANDTVRDHLRSALTAEALRVAIALKRHKAANGTYPDSLDALIPAALDAVPLDMATGEPVKYVVLDEGFLLLPPLDPEHYYEGGVYTELHTVLWRAMR
ncbi:MAG: hypothetical protein AMXMBFR4_13690 [Candidatus Hydrogenedentota bacterium]